MPVGVENSLVDKYRDQGLITTQFKEDVVVQEMGGKYVAVFDPLGKNDSILMKTQRLNAISISYCRWFIQC